MVFGLAIDYKYAEGVHRVDQENHQGHIQQPRTVLAVSRHYRGLLEHLPLLHEDVRSTNQLQQGSVSLR